MRPGYIKPEIKLYCKYCNKELHKPCALATHERVCVLNPNRRPLENNGNGWKYVNEHRKAPYGTWKCKWCENETIFNTRRELSQHLKEFHANQSKSGGWNKGLTAKTNESVAKGRDSFLKSIENGTYKPVGRKHTEEEKKKLSEYAKKNGLRRLAYFKNY